MASKKLWTGVLVFGISLILSNCSTLTITFKDQIIPENQQCKMLIAANLYVTEFDGETVSWNSYFRPTVIIISEGEHTIISEWRTDNYYVKGPLTVTHEFETGKRYRLYGQVVGPGLGTSVRLIVQDVTNISKYKKVFK